MDAGREAGDILNVLNAAQIEAFRRHRGQADRNFAERFFMASGRDHDFVESSAGCIGGLSGKSGQNAAAGEREQMGRAESRVAHKALNNMDRVDQSVKFT
jgi:hypothetical protein